MHVSSSSPVIHPLKTGEVHIWRLQPEPAIDLSSYIRILSHDEQERAQRFRLPELTRSFIADHGRMRLILSAYAQLPPQDLAFTQNKFGKPELDIPGSALRFNLSHTKGLSVLALCLDSQIGVDVEAVRLMKDWQEIAQSHFSPRENADLSSTIESDRQNAFFRCWTRKEAFLKANGYGLSKPLDSFSVSIAREEFPALLDCVWAPQEVSGWSLASLSLEPQFVGALAVQHRGWKILSFDWDGMTGKP
jgi:4'-phosphopantetheinyl transferase